MTWLLVDANYLCHRAWHTVGHLAHRGESTGVAFGFLRELDYQKELHGINNCVIAFDHPGPGLRQGILPTYKETRRTKKRTDVEVDQRKDMNAQMVRLRAEYLPALGYRNVLEAEGYEADDIIALAAEILPTSAQAVILTADEDLLQCITPRVRWHSPAKGKTVTFDSFCAEWGITPGEWATVKALAGCGTDDVPGLRGIGDKTAAKYLAGNLKKTTVAYNKILADQDQTIRRNKKLVTLPFPGLRLPMLGLDDVTIVRRRAVDSWLGFGRSGKVRKRAAVKQEGFGL